jgi:hypothetical protein
MFTAYFDDSGTHDGATNVVRGGLIAPLEQWLCFEADWNAILQMPQFDLDFLHMKEMKSGKGKFAKFQANLRLQADLYDRVQRLTKLRAKSFGCCVNADVYARVDADYELHERLGGPFVLASRVALHKVSLWMEARHQGEAFQFVFDRVKCWAELRRHLKEQAGQFPVPGEMRKMAPLQAADHMVWEMHRANHKMIGTDYAPRSVDFRGSFHALMRRFGTDDWVNVQHEDELRAVCADFPVPRRAQV